MSRVGLTNPCVYVCPCADARRRFANLACGFRSLSHLRERNARSQVRRRILRNEPAPWRNRYATNTRTRFVWSRPPAGRSLPALRLPRLAGLLLSARSRYRLFFLEVRVKIPRFARITPRERNEGGEAVSLAVFNPPHTIDRIHQL